MVISSVNRFIHKHGKVTFTFILVVIAIPFVFMTGGGGRPSARKIDMDQVVATYSGEEMTMGNLFDSYPRLTASNLNPESKYIIDGLLERQITLEEARSQGLDEVSKEDLLAEIVKSYPGRFDTDGKFDFTKYNSMPEVVRVRLEKSTQEKISTTRLTNKITAQGTAAVTNAQIKTAYNEANRSLDISALTLKSHKFTKDAKVTEEEIKAYFTKNIEDYRIAEKKSIQIVTFNKKDFISQVKVDDATLEPFYNETKVEKYNFGKVKAAHILIKVAKGAKKEDDAKAKKKIEDVLAAVKKGDKKFADLAKEFSEGPSNVKGGDLGWFTTGRMVPEFEKVIFVEKDGKLTTDVKMKKGEVSGIIKTQFGYHILTVTDLPKTFKQLKPRVSIDYKKPQAKILMEKAAYKFAAAVYDKVIEGSTPFTTAPTTFVELAKEAKLKVVTSKAFTVDSTIPEMKTKYFSKIIEKLDFTNPISEGIVSDNGLKSFVISIKTVVDSKLPEYKDSKDIKAKITKILKAEKSIELMDTAADKAIADLKAGLKAKTDFKTLAKTLKLKKIKTFKANKSPEGLNAGTPAKKELTGKQVGDVVGPVKFGKGIDILYVEKITNPTAKEFEAGKSAFAKTFRQSEGTKAWTTYRKALVEKAEIKLFTPFVKEETTTK